MSHEHGGTNYDHQEPGGSMYDCITLVLKKICHLQNQNNITVPFNNITHKMVMMQNWNGLHQ